MLPSTVLIWYTSHGLKIRKKMIHLRRSVASATLVSQKSAFLHADLPFEHTCQKMEERSRFINDHGVKPEFQWYNPGYYQTPEWLRDKVPVIGGFNRRQKRIP